MTGNRNPLDLVPKLRQEQYRDSIETIISGRRPTAPKVVELDPTSFCDLACPECISGELLNTNRLTPDRLRELAQEMADIGVAAVILIGGGEPLLHPAIKDVIQVLHSKDVKIGLTTNGTQIHRYLDIIAECVAWTRISMDAATPETYAQFRPSRSGRNMFRHVIDSIEKLSKAKKGRLGYSFLVMARLSKDGQELVTNAGEILAAAHLAKDIGCDYFEVKPEYDMKHYLRGHEDSLAQIIAGQKDELRALDDENYSVLLQRNLAVVEAGEHIEQPKSYDHCHVADLRTLITPSGAYLCPYYRGRPEANYGDPSTESLSSLWNGARRDRVGRDIKPSESCRFHCIRHESNLEIIDRQTDSTSARHDLVPDYDPFI